MSGKEGIEDMAVYVVQPGDTLGKIAAQYNISLQDLLMFNPGITNPDIINVGQEITVPGGAPPTTAPPATQPPVTTPPATSPPSDPTSTQAALRQYSTLISTLVQNQNFEAQLVDGLLYIVILNQTSYRMGEPVRIRLLKVNVTNRSITLHYDTGQRLELEVRDERGRLIWRYSRNRLFIQQTGSVTIRPNSYAIYENVWDQEDNSGRQVSAGNYRLEVFNVAREVRDESVTIEFRIRERGVTPTPGPGPVPCTGQNLIENSGFESWSSRTSPRSWSATNVRRTTDAHRGSYALEMGDDPTRRSTLSQEFSVTPGSNNRVSFWVAEDVQNARAGNFSLGVQLLLRDRSGDVVAVVPEGPYSPEAIENEVYEQFTFTTGRIPGTAVSAELIFTFTPTTGNPSQVRVDDVEFRCLGL